MEANQYDLEVFARLKYEGELVADGFMDAYSSGQILINIDEALKFFIYQQNQALKGRNFEIPVRIQKGSWVVDFVENIDLILLKTALFWGASKYFGSALSEMAKNDFKELGFRSIFKNAFKAMTWVVKISVHVGNITTKKFKQISFAKNNQIVKIENSQGEELEVPIEYLEAYTNCPPQLFERLAELIEEERELILEYDDKEKNDSERVLVEYSSKSIFYNAKDEDDEILFPELVHGEYVELDGHITRGNESSNTIGFLYKGHILTSYPDKGNVKSIKDKLFTNCIMKGFVDRKNKKTGDYIDRRPRIRFIQLISNDPEGSQIRLF